MPFEKNDPIHSERLPAEGSGFGFIRNLTPAGLPDDLHQR